MKILGFNFIKISVEKSETVTDEDIKINTNINLSEIKEVESPFLNKDEMLLGVKFNYNVNYTPDFAKIELKGGLVVALNTKDAKEVLKQWKEKKTPDGFKLTVFNVLLRKANLKALELEEELNLPLHITLPSLKGQPKEDSK